MHKSKAIELLGGSIAAAAEAIGVSYQAINQWPDELPDRISDRVLAAIARKHLPSELIGDEAKGSAATQPERAKASNEVHSEPAQVLALDNGDEVTLILKAKKIPAEPWDGRERRAGDRRGNGGKPR